MGTVTEAIRRHHRALLETITEKAAVLEGGVTSPDAEELVIFLREDLLPHAVGEERSLYPAVEALIKSYGRPTATMSIDHEFIEGYIRDIEETVEALREAGADVRPALERRLLRHVLQLEALLKVHLEKEERVYLPLFERYLPEADQERVLEEMHAAHHETPGGGIKTLDVRGTPPPHRHPLIFRAFDELRSGEAFILVNDHDPKPLYYQFKYEREGQFTWDYLEQGPEVWRVRIGKTGA